MIKTKQTDPNRMPVKKVKDKLHTHAHLYGKYAYFWDGAWRPTPQPPLPNAEAMTGGRMVERAPTLDEV